MAALRLSGLRDRTADGRTDEIYKNSAILVTFEFSPYLQYSAVAPSRPATSRPPIALISSQQAEKCSSLTSVLPCLAFCFSIQPTIPTCIFVITASEKNMSTARPTNESANQALGQASDDAHSMTSNPTTSSLALVPYNPNPFPLLRLSLQIHDPNLRKLLLPTAGVTPTVDVPSCIVPTILSFCDAVTLSRASCTCRDWRTLAACNKIWENLCRKKFGVSADCIRPKPDPT